MRKNSSKRIQTRREHVLLYWKKRLTQGVEELANARRFKRLGGDIAPADVALYRDYVKTQISALEAKLKAEVVVADV